MRLTDYPLQPIFPFLHSKSERDQDLRAGHPLPSEHGHPFIDNQQHISACLPHPLTGRLPPPPLLRRLLSPQALTLYPDARALRRRLLCLCRPLRAHLRGDTSIAIDTRVPLLWSRKGEENSNRRPTRNALETGKQRAQEDNEHRRATSTEAWVRRSAHGTSKWW